MPTPKVAAITPSSSVTVMSEGCHRGDVYQGQLANISTHAAADAREVGALLLRAYAQAETAAACSDVLDLIDDLLMEAAYEFAKTVGEAER